MKAKIAVSIAVALLALVAAGANAQVAPAEPLYTVGLRHIEYVDRSDGLRTLVMNVFYPAVLPSPAPKPFTVPFTTNVRVYDGAEIAAAEKPFPLIMLSHGRGSNGMFYAWFAQYLAARGYIVAAPDHYRANSYDRTIVYLANKLWQRPRDVSLDITYLTTHEPWSQAIDAERIGVAGHSQGGFTALWIAGARVDGDKFLGFQRHWRDDPAVPRYLRDQMPVDATPALNVTDERVRAAFAMAPGIIQAFGMDAQTLAGMTVPAYITVGAADTVTPPADNAQFAAAHIRNAKLEVIPGRVGHEIFTNECDAEGKMEIPETCVDDPSVNRGAIHQAVGEAAFKFFNANLPPTATR